MPDVKLYAGLRKAAGIKEVQLDGSRLEDVLLALVDQYPDLRQILYDEGCLRPHIIINVNGNNVNQEQRPDLVLAPDDQIAIFPPIAGG